LLDDELFDGVDVAVDEGVVVVVPFDVDDPDEVEIPEEVDSLVTLSALL
jgi:hypothetical protein